MKQERSMRGKERAAWVCLIVLLLFALVASIFHLEGSLDKANKKIEHLEYANDQLQEINTHLTDRAWSLQFQLQNEKDTSQ